MNCYQTREKLYLYIDGELDSQTNLSVKEHLSSCPLCNLEVEQEKKIDLLFGNSISKENAPYELKERILSQIEELGEKKVSSFARPLLKPAMATVVVASLTVTLIIFVLGYLNKPFPVFSEAVKDHIRLVQGKSPMGIASNSSEEVRKWLQSRLDFKVMVPHLSSQDVSLLGARLCSIKNKKAAYIAYEKNGHTISVLMFDAEGIKFPEVKNVAVNNKIYYLSKVKGYNSALWIDEGIACVFVSDLGEAELLYLASL